jgi:hypothetical protein
MQRSARISDAFIINGLSRPLMPGVMPLKTMGRSPEKELRRLRYWRVACGAVCAVAFLNFVAYLVGAGLVGGDAVGGKVEGGRYFVWGYLGQSWAKGYKEVSQEVFSYSKWHGYSAIVGSLFLLLAAYRLKPDSKEGMRMDRRLALSLARRLRA